MQKTHQQPPETKLNTCPELPPLKRDWMIPKTISIQDKGICNVLVVVPHGYPKDDDNAEILGYHVAELLGAYAIINNRLYNRKDKSSSSKPDLNLIKDAESVAEYWSPLTQFLKAIPEKYGKPALVFFIHGMGDDKARDHRAGEVCVGKGFTGEYDSQAASGSADFFDDLLENLRAAGFDTTDNVGAYSGESKLPRELRRQFGASVEAVQIEFRCTGCRDSAESIRKTAFRMAEAIAYLEGFHTQDGTRMVHSKDATGEGTSSHSRRRCGQSPYQEGRAVYQPKSQ